MNASSGILPILSVNKLSISFETGDRESAAVQDLSFEIFPGEIVAVLGESGSGKTTLGTALTGVLPESASIRSGSVRIAGEETTQLDEKSWQPIRGQLVSMIWQEPRIALNPVLRVGTQVEEVVRAHNRWAASKCKETALAALTDVQLDAAKIYSAFPHELSGGQCQRVAIAQAIVCRPQLIIADEPTSALDSTTQAEILDLIAKLREQTQTAFLLITHNPAIVSRLADRVLVMNGGKIVEQGNATAVLSSPSHPYTRALLESRGSLLQATEYRQ